MSVDLESLGEQIAEHAAHLDAALHRLLCDLRQFDAEGGWAAQGARSCAHWLSWRVGWDMATSREHVRVARKLAKLSKIDRALQHGELSYSKVRAITRVATEDTEQMLLETAQLSTAQQLEAICRKYATAKRHDQDVGPADDAGRRYVTRRDTADGMVRIEAVLHPEEAAVVWAALEGSANRTCRESQHAPAETLLEVVEVVPAAPPADGAGPIVVTEIAVGGRASAGSTEQDRGAPVLPEHSARPGAFDRADALVAMAQGYVRGDRPDRAPVELVITVGDRTLSAGSDAADPGEVACFADGTCVSAATARRLACDAGVVEVMEDERGQPLSVGRKTRTIPGAMKRALLKRDETCRFPGCTHRLFLEGHHIQHWARGGETRLDNIVCVVDYLQVPPSFCPRVWLSDRGRRRWPPVPRPEWSSRARRTRHAATGGPGVGHDPCPQRAVRDHPADERVRMERRSPRRRRHHPPATAR